MLHVLPKVLCPSRLKQAGSRKRRRKVQRRARSWKRMRSKRMLLLPLLNIPWNLRKRKATCYAPQEKGRKRSHCSSPSSLALGSEDSGKAAMRGMVVGQNGPRRKFSVSLSRKEIEEDFYAFQGTKPNRRPKKRPKAVQKQLDALFTGLWLSEITKDMYKIAE